MSYLRINQSTWKGEISVGEIQYILFFNCFIVLTFFLLIYINYTKGFHC
jgi:hypothetical protein